MAGQGSRSGAHPTDVEEPDRVLEPGLIAWPEAPPLPCAPLFPPSPPPSLPAGTGSRRAWTSDPDAFALLNSVGVRMPQAEGQTWDFF